MTKRDTVEANGAWVGSWNSKHDADFGLVYDPLHWRQFIANNTNGRGNPRIYGNIIDKSGEVLDWLTDYMDDVCQSEYKTDLQWGAGISDTHLCIAWPDPDGAGDTEGLYSGFPKLMQAIVDRIEENGATILYETPAVQLVTDDSGAVVAAIGQTSKG